MHSGEKARHKLVIVKARVPVSSGDRETKCSPRLHLWENIQGKSERVHSNELEEASTPILHLVESCSKKHKIDSNDEIGEKHSPRMTPFVAYDHPRSIAKRAVMSTEGEPELRSAAVAIGKRSDCLTDFGTFIAFYHVFSSTLLFRGRVVTP